MSVLVCVSSTCVPQLCLPACLLLLSLVVSICVFVAVSARASSLCVCLSVYTCACCAHVPKDPGASLVMQDVEEAEARAAFIWILGEHGQAIQVHLHMPLHVISALTGPKHFNASCMPSFCPDDGGHSANNCNACTHHYHQGQALPC